MHIKRFILALVLVCAPAGSFAKETLKIACSEKSVCVDSSDFIAEVMRVRHRGSIATVQVRFVAKKENLMMKFRYGGGSSYVSYGHATLVDANGQEITIKGSDISNFELNKGEKQVVSFTFKSQDKKSITEPFDVTVKSQGDEITFFDLRSKGQRVNNIQK